MQVKVENVEKNVVQLEIEVDAAKFEEGMKKAFVKNAGKFNIPGFRKGKAPRNIVEKYYGEQVLYEDAFNIVCPEAYDKAVEENNIHPVDKPELDIKEIGDGKNLIFTARVTVKPEVEVGNYKGVEVKKAEAVVTDEDVEGELQKIVDKNARLITIEDRGVQSGDTAIIDFEGFVDDVAFEGGKGENYSLEIGSGSFIPGFEEQLIGMTTGSEADINVSFPEDYGKDELAGKASVFKVKVNEIKVKELPALDDEFAKDVSEFDTLEEYKSDLRKNLVEKAEHQAEHQNEDNVVQKIVESTEVDIPDAMIEKRLDSVAYDFDMRLRYQGLDLEKYLGMMNMDMPTFREQFRKKAEQEVKTQLVIEKISALEGISAAEEDVEAEIAKLAENYKQELVEFKKHLQQDDIEYIKGNLIANKTLDFLVKNAQLI